MQAKMSARTRFEKANEMQKMLHGYLVASITTDRHIKRNQRSAYRTNRTPGGETSLGMNILNLVAKLAALFTENFSGLTFDFLSLWKEYFWRIEKIV